MVKVISGKKGSGKTKRLIEMVNDSAKISKGNVVCIEKNKKLTYELSHDVRLISASDFDFQGYEGLYGFICGMISANYDITEIYVDSITKIVDHDFDKIGELLERIDNNVAKDNINFTVTVSEGESEVPDSIKKYMI